ncbi:MAG: hypothetical protein AB7O68_23060 [Pirellulales bacterium]
MATSLLDLLPDDLRVAPRVIPPEQNAWEPLREAGRLFVGRSEDMPAHWPPDDSRNEGFQGSAAEVRAMIAANEPAIAALDEAIARRSIESPDPTAGFELGFDSAVRFWRLLALRIQIHLFDGQVATAALDGLRLLKLGRMLICDSNCGNATTGEILVGSAAGLLRRIADDPRIEPATLLALLAEAKTCCDLHDGLAENVKLQLRHWTFPVIERLRQARSGDLHDLIAILVDQQVGEDLAEPDLSDDECWLEATRHSVRRETLRGCLGYILRGHPRPYDEEETIAWLITDAREAIHQLAGDARSGWPRIVAPLVRWWNNRGHKAPRVVANSWPVWVWRFGFSAYDDIEEEDYSREVFEDDYQNYLVRPNEDRLVAARRHIQGTSNPVGRLLLGQLAIASSEYVARLTEGSIRLTSLVIGLRLHEVVHGTLPKRLRHLVQAGVLDRLPVDPFTGRSFYYNAKTATVWSAGDAEDPSRWSERPDEPIARRLAWQLASHRGPAS